MYLPYRQNNYTNYYLSDFIHTEQSFRHEIIIELDGNQGTYLDNRDFKKLQRQCIIIYVHVVYHANGPPS